MAPYYAITQRNQPVIKCKALFLQLFLFGGVTGLTKLPPLGLSGAVLSPSCEYPSSLAERACGACVCTGGSVGCGTLCATASRMSDLQLGAHMKVSLSCAETEVKISRHHSPALCEEPLLLIVDHLRTGRRRHQRSTSTKSPPFEGN